LFIFIFLSLYIYDLYTLLLTGLLPILLNQITPYYYYKEKTANWKEKISEI